MQGGKEEEEGGSDEELRRGLERNSPKQPTYSPWLHWGRGRGEGAFFVLRKLFFFLLTYFDLESFSRAISPLLLPSFPN